MSQGWPRTREFAKRVVRSTTVLFLVATLFLLVSQIIYEHSRSPGVAYRDLTARAQTVDGKITLSADELYDFVSRVDRHDGLQSLTTLATLMREIAFALIIAAVIGLLIERAAKQSIGEEVSSYNESIAQNVLRAVLARSFPRDVINYIFDNILSIPFVRVGVGVKYTIKSLVRSDGVVDDDRIVLGVRMVYTVQNISSQPQVLPIPFDIIVCNNNDGCPAGVTGVRAVRYSAIPFVVSQSLPELKSMSAADISRGVQERHSKLVGHWEYPVCPIMPDQAVMIELECDVLRESADVEYFHSKMTALRVEVDVDCQLPHIVFSVEFNDRNKIDGSGDGKRFWSRGPVLSYQGLNVSWKRRSNGQHVNDLVNDAAKITNV